MTRVPTVVVAAAAIGTHHPIVVAAVARPPTAHPQRRTVRVTRGRRRRLRCVPPHLASPRWTRSWWRWRPRSPSRRLACRRRSSGHGRSPHSSSRRRPSPSRSQAARSSTATTRRPAMPAAGSTAPPPAVVQSTATATAAARLPAPGVTTPARHPVAHRTAAPRVVEAGPAAASSTRPTAHAAPAADPLDGSRRRRRRCLGLGLGVVEAADRAGTSPPPLR